MDQHWKPIKGYEGIYMVLNIGQVKSLDRIDSIGRLKKGLILSDVDNGNGYRIVNLKFNGKQKMYTVHRLVAEAFIPNPMNLPQVNHIDGDKSNNKLENLEWCDKSHNMKHAYKIGLIKALDGEKSPHHKLKKSDVEYCKSNYKKYDPKYGFAALARFLGVSDTTIKHAVYGTNWKGVK